MDSGLFYEKIYIYFVCLKWVLTFCSAAMKWTFFHFFFFFFSFLQTIFSSDIDCYHWKICVCCVLFSFFPLFHFCCINERLDLFILPSLDPDIRAASSAEATAAYPSRLHSRLTLNLNNPKSLILQLFSDAQQKSDFLSLVWFEQS